MWTVYRKGVFGRDLDYCWENEFDYFDNKADAEKMAKELEKNFADDGWDGHRDYKASFYAAEISEDVIRQKQYQHALWMANMV